MRREKPRLSPTLAVFLATALAAGAPAAFAQAEGPAAIHAHAVELQKEGRFEEAVAEYRRLLAVVPGSPEARSNLAAALVRLGRLEEAIREYKEALAQGNAPPAVRFNLALAYYKASLLPDASRELELVLRADPGHRAARVLRADLALRVGDAGRAIALLEPLDAKDPDDKAVAYLLGMAYLRNGRDLRGQLLLDKILRAGDSAEAHLMMGTAHNSAGEYADARREFERAAALNPDLPGVHALFGRSLMTVGETAGAVDAFRRELRSNPSDFQANLYLGVLLKQDQKNDEALECFRRALLAKPGAPEVRYQKGALQLIMGDVPAALDTLEAVVKEEPSFLEAHVSLATVYYRLKRKADGDRERALAQELTRQIQAKEPGAKDELGPAYRGESAPPAPPSSPDPAAGRP